MLFTYTYSIPYLYLCEKKKKNLDTISNYMMKLHVTISVTGMRTRQNGVTVWDGFMVQSQKMW